MTNELPLFDPSNQVRMCATEHFCVTLRWNTMPWERDSMQIVANDVGGIHFESFLPNVGVERGSRKKICIHLCCSTLACEGMCALVVLSKLSQLAVLTDPGPLEESAAMCGRHETNLCEARCIEILLHTMTCAFMSTLFLNHFRPNCKRCLQKGPRMAAVTVLDLTSHVSTRPAWFYGGETGLVLFRVWRRLPYRSVVCISRPWGHCSGDQDLPKRSEPL